MSMSQYRRQSSATHDAAGHEQSLEKGDTVEVPGDMTGIVRYIGSVRGKSGVFVGVELSEEYSQRGKNDGDFEGVQYFTPPAIAGSGIFIPASRAIRLNPPRTFTAPRTPITRKVAGHVDTPTPAFPSFSQSMGPESRPPFSQSLGPKARPPSPQSKLKSRPSLPRPASPTRKTPLPQLASRPSIGAFRPPASPLPVRPSKPSTPHPIRAQSRSQSRAGDFNAEENTPTNAGVGRPSIGGRASSTNVSHSEELRKLRQQITDKNEELEDYKQRFADQESSIQQLQTSMAQLEKHQRQSSKPPSEANEIAQLRAQLREKDDLTAELEAHRHNFRDTIDALEAASAETERVYSKRVQELEQEVEELQAHREEMEAVTEQFTQLEGMVQELEEGLDDARRSQSEATRRVEELEGELERAKLELGQERERSVAVAAAHATLENTSMSNSSLQKDLQQKEDEIRGLKAIIHNLSSSSTISTSNLNAAEAEQVRRTNASLLAEISQLRASASHRAAPSTPTSPPSTVTTSTPPKAKRSSSFARDRDSLDGIMHPGTMATSSGLASRFPTADRRGYGMSPTGIENDSSADTGTEADLWCEICEQAGHDVLSCQNILDSRAAGRPAGWKTGEERVAVETPYEDDDGEEESEGGGWVPESAFSRPKTMLAEHSQQKSTKPAIATSTAEADRPPEATSIASYGETGPAPGMRSGRIDMNKWCAFCERDGHDSVDCPFEEEL